jgi:glycine betaine/proline transport system permease protein
VTLQAEDRLADVTPGTDGAPNRRKWFALAGVFVVWILGWALLKGKQTLEIGVAENTDFHRWLLDFRDSVEGQRDSNPVLTVVIGGISDGLDWLVTFFQELVSQPAFPRPVPEIGWLGVLAIAVTVAYALAGTRIAVLAGATLLACGYLGYWEDSLDLLIVTGVAVGICVLIGLPLGIWMARSKRATAVITPVLDVMQTMPSFAYLAPLVLFFGIGAASAVVTTVIYSLPPLVRISAHGLRSVAPATVEASTSLGSTSGQLLRSVQLPMARRTILVGLNQTTMAALSMATIAALINGPGLGQPVIEALQINDVGSAAVSGLCIVLLAIMLDRATTAAGERAELAQRSGHNPQVRRIVLAVLGVLTVVAVYLSRQYIRLATFPESELGPRTADLVSDLTDAVVDAIRPITQAVKDFVTYGFLNPLQSLLTESPWWLMAGVLLAFAYLLGGVRALASTLVCVAVILGTGLWNESMVTLASTLVATVLVMVLGIAVGVWMGRSRRVDTSIRPVLDALQTIPPFVYLIPALALFGPGRFTAIVAAVAYAAPVATKLVADGVRGVSATSVEAAESAGTSTGQMIRKVQLPMARGAVILALNQGLLFVLSMVVIGGLVGGGGLGFLVVTGFAQSEDFGKGLAAGIAITALGVMLDRISVYTAASYGRAAPP